MHVDYRPITDEISNGLQEQQSVFFYEFSGFLIKRVYYFPAKNIIAAKKPVVVVILRVLLPPHTDNVNAVNFCGHNSMEAMLTLSGQLLDLIHF